MLLLVHREKPKTSEYLFDEGDVSLSLYSLFFICLPEPWQ